MLEEDETGTGGKDLRCHNCGGVEFMHRTAQLNTPFLTFLSLDWLNASADVFVCDQCGYLHWFLSPGAVMGGGGFDCLSCGAEVPAGKDTCPVCGWTYRTEEGEEAE
jgi:predicted RNA-binding Zn-ribbon protein involved in translation (DUF1610 family)